MWWYNKFRINGIHKWYKKNLNSIRYIFNTLNIIFIWYTKLRTVIEFILKKKKVICILFVEYYIYILIIDGWNGKNVFVIYDNIFFIDLYVIIFFKKWKKQFS